MNEPDDLTLLQRYVRQNSDDAFAELVSRRVNFVYSAALRQVRDPHLAEEITQAVFIILAQKAGKISDKTILTGWFFRTTQFVALAQIRAAAKQSLRTATLGKDFQMQIMDSESPTASDELWNQLAPLLDDALAQLGETDRQAVLLRFFENKSLAEVGNFLGIGEDTARKRVARALEKLHRYFNQHGVSSTTAILAGELSANSLQAAPVGLAKTISTVAVLKGAAASTSTLTLIKGALKIMAWSKLKTAIVVGIGTLLFAAMTTAVVAEIKAHVKSTPVFTAEGLVSTEFHRDQRHTNDVLKSDGRFLFSYSNGVWWIQFTYQHQTLPPELLAAAGLKTAPTTTIDEKRIPDGIRKIVTFPTLADEAKSVKTKPFAIANLNTIPEMGERGLFLPWLSLSPNLELPLVDLSHIHSVFMQNHYDNGEDSSRFKVNYIEPAKRFLSELIITNNGSMRTSDGKTHDWPEPYKNGFVEFSYKVLDTTNCDGIIFPLNAASYQFTPLQHGKSSEDLFLTSITTLTIKKIDVGGRHLSLTPVPASIVALDSRFGLPNDITVNYEVVNDQWNSLTNKRLQQLVNMYRHNQTQKNAK